MLPTELAVTSWSNATSNQAIALESILGLNCIGLELDVDAIMSNPCGSPAKPKKKPAPRRGSRLTDIKLLEKVLQDYPRAARDDAIATRDMTGVPKLLPRPMQEEFGKLAGLKPYKVTRCMRDKNAQMLR